MVTTASDDEVVDVPAELVVEDLVVVGGSAIVVDSTLVVESMVVLDSADEEDSAVVPLSVELVDFAMDSEELVEVEVAIVLVVLVCEHTRFVSASQSVARRNVSPVMIAGGPTAL